MSPYSLSNEIARLNKNMPKKQYDHELGTLIGSYRMELNKIVFLIESCPFYFDYKEYCIISLKEYNKCLKDFLVRCLNNENNIVVDVQNLYLSELDNMIKYYDHVLLFMREYYYSLSSFLYDIENETLSYGEMKKILSDKRRRV